MKSTYPASLRAAGLIALDYNNGDADKVSQLTGFPAQTLREWAKNRNNPAVEWFYYQMAKDMRVRLEEIANQTLNAIEDKLADPTKILLRDLTGLLETSLDKLAVLSGNPQSISGAITVSGNLEEFQRIKESALIKLLSEAGERQEEGCPPDKQIPVTPALVAALNREVDEDGEQATTTTEAMPWEEELPK
jgi:hypothetical protein